ncbi:hypothetical protein PGT21_033602 [Puccinia graminis f. sp. tritici]|uniref:Uncharacterized protein n=1 Tax=Puccinia graminis f. sp. tritici TaxID=56615 RepID=A0A5B0NQ91_PUCGR|nr:hypothetical protein PGTUg99_035128 [Puccinia graminis f. sp. tritici]KAA1091431.1 hypothetical protein PGT21_033602 [Puccinia graminis f. sp. tritici]
MCCDRVTRLFLVHLWSTCLASEGPAWPLKLSLGRGNVDTNLASFLHGNLVPPQAQDYNANQANLAAGSTASSSGQLQSAPFRNKRMKMLKNHSATGHHRASILYDAPVLGIGSCPSYQKLPTNPHEAYPTVAVQATQYHPKPYQDEHPSAKRVQLEQSSSSIGIPRLQITSTKHLLRDANQLEHGSTAHNYPKGYGNVITGASKSTAPTRWEWQNGHLPRVETTLDGSNSMSMPTPQKVTKLTDILVFNVDVFRRDEYLSAACRAKADSIISLIPQSPKGQKLKFSHVSPEDLHSHFRVVSRRINKHSRVDYLRFENPDLSYIEKHRAPSSKRGSLLNDSLNELYSNRRLWFRFWEERTGVELDVGQIDLLQDDKRTSQPFAQRHLTLLLFYIDMIVGCDRG